MIKDKVTIENKLGLHARSASVFVRTASAYQSSIKVSNEHASANGKSIMSMMLLQASHGTEIELLIEGDDEEAAFNAITSLIRNKFGEDQ